MKKSKFLNLNAVDFFKGLLVALLTAFLTGFYQLLQAGSEFNWVTLKPVVLSSIAAGLSYLIKNLLENSNGQFAKDEKGIAPDPGISKIIILIFLLSGICIYSQGQAPIHPPIRNTNQVVKSSPWDGFFKPVDRSLFNAGYIKGAEDQSAWLFRPTVELSALQFIPSDEPGVVFDVSTFQSVGLGLSYQHFISFNNMPYNNYGFNLLFLFDQIPKETTTLNLSVAGTVNALKFLNVGAGYNFGMNKIFILTGITYNFN